MIHLKSTEVADRYRPTSDWGPFTRYVEIGADHFITRHIDVHENGNALRYDRQYWSDDWGQLGDMKYDKSKWETWWGPSDSISAEEFESVWEAVLDAPNQPQRYRQDRGVCPVFKRLDRDV